MLEGASAPRPCPDSMDAGSGWQEQSAIAPSPAPPARQEQSSIGPSPAPSGWQEQSSIRALARPVALDRADSIAPPMGSALGLSGQPSPWQEQSAILPTPAPSGWQEQSAILPTPAPSGWQEQSAIGTRPPDLFVGAGPAPAPHDVDHPRHHRRRRVRVRRLAALRPGHLTVRPAPWWDHQPSRPAAAGGRSRRRPVATAPADAAPRPPTPNPGRRGDLRRQESASRRRRRARRRPRRDCAAALAHPRNPGHQLTIASTPPGARVFLDGADAGVTPSSCRSRSPQPRAAPRRPRTLRRAGRWPRQFGSRSSRSRRPRPRGIKVIKCKDKERYYVFVDGKPTG